jgi:DNA-binding NarL/FixJ family response regulator
MNNHVKPKRVLVVDDVPSVREALRWALEAEADLPVVGEAGDGVLALELAQALSPDLIILDIELPKLNGYDVARTLKRASQPPLVIFISVHADSASRQQALAAGGDGFVEKGLGWLALIAQIRALVEGR